GAGRQRQNDLRDRRSVALLYSLFPVEPDSIGRHCRLESTGYLTIEERQEDFPPVDQVHFCSERGERAGVLATDHPCTNYRQLSWQRLQLEDLVRVVNPLVFEWEFGRP